MSYRETIYKNALEMISHIYEESKYNPEKDLYRSFDILNSVNDNQFASKEWLVDRLVPFINQEKTKNIAILGGWYGLTGVILRHSISPDVNIYSVDCDDLTIEIGQRLIGSHEMYANNHFRIDDAGAFFFDRSEMFQVIINTSCEHMEQDDLLMMIHAKRKNAIVCFQSNNYHSVQSHINTHNSLDEFVDSLNLVKVLHKEEFEAPNKNYSRYMVIGI
jgi:hypothetical protein